MKLSLISIEPDGVRIASDGPMTATDFHSGLENPIETLLGASWSKHKLVVDMSRTDYIDSSAIGWLLKCHREVKKGGGALVLHSMPARVRQILNLLKIENVLPLASDEPAAMAALRGEVK